jgi:hypothetical protein
MTRARQADGEAGAAAARIDGADGGGDDERRGARAS